MTVDLNIREAPVRYLALGRPHSSLSLRNGTTKPRRLLPALYKLGTRKHVQGCPASKQTYKPTLLTPVLDMLVRTPSS